jgi:hypothetical protein
VARNVITTVTGRMVFANLQEPAGS